MEEFLKEFEEQFAGVETGSVKPDSNFRNIEGWDSLTAMLIIDMMSEKYNTIITADNLRACQTVNDLFKLTQKNG
jgi:acyl carrier protein